MKSDKMTSAEYQAQVVNKRRRSHTHPEYDEQVMVATYLNTKYPDLLWSASAGGMRTNIGTAIKMKLSGYKKGCPDIMIFKSKTINFKQHSAILFYGLFIEMKRVKGGVQSPNQESWQGRAGRNGYKYVVCAGANEAIGVIEAYLEDK